MTKPDSVMQSFICDAKYISRKYMKFQIHFNFTKPVKDIWLHTVLYHKFNGLVYQKFPIDLWENMCEWLTARLAGKKTLYMLNWTLGRIIDESTFNHTCPFVGYQAIDVKNISIDAFVVEPLIPSGRYRMQLDFADGGRVTFGTVFVFFSVSDYRLEKI